MISKKIKYVDYDGNKREEEFFFNLNKAELLQMEMSADGGLEKMIRRIVSAQDNKKIMELFNKIILAAYGEKSDDGRRFIKSEKLSKEFSETEAYSDLIMELSTNEDAAAKFIQGMLPQTDNIPVPQNKVVEMKK